MTRDHSGVGLKSLARWTGSEALEPRQIYQGDAGFDLVVAEDTWIESGQFEDVDCGIKIALPKGTWGWLVGRSSTLRRRKLLVAGGIIDQGYRGDIFCGVWNMNKTGVMVKQHERIAQLLILPLESDRIQWLRIGTNYWNEDETQRGARGFGSTNSLCEHIDSIEKEDDKESSERTTSVPATWVPRTDALSEAQGD